MAAFPPMHHYYRPDTLPQDQYSQGYCEDDEGSILDENILDSSALDSGLEMSPPMAGSRRDSFAVSSTAMFSPKQEEWQHVEMQPLPSNNPFGEQNSNNPFLRSEASAYGQQNNGWALSNGSGMSTPMQAGHDGLPTDFDITASIFQRPVPPGQTPFSTPGYPHSMFSSTNNSSPASPQEKWSVPEGMDHRQMPKRMRPHSPTLRSHGDITRRDGIRKKNARFDIPAERNLSNIDHMIAASTDETEIKELKQQKRLLRNRQAALDSRQRKKQHTERLEDEKKHYTAVITDLEDDLAEMRLTLEKYAQKEQQWEHLMMNMQREKEDMLRAHTLESGDLRKKVSILTDHVKHLESTPMPPPQDSAGYATAYTDIDSLTMDSAWDNISFLHDYPLENEIKAENNAILPMKKVDTSFSSDSEKPAAQGLLLMLLLVGAFVASKGTSAVPKMSDDVRAASATLLQDVFKDAGVQNSTPAVFEAVAPLPSGNAWQPASTPTSFTNNGMVGGPSSTLGDLADSLSQPTQLQINEQAFSLSAAQYDGIASQDFLSNPPPRSTSAGRRNLAESLAAMRANSKKSAAEVYTRSLLWDQVPSEVVRNFAKLVSECNHNKHGHDSGGSTAGG